MTSLNIQSSELQDFKNPFRKESVESIWFNMRKNIFTGNPTYTAAVKFKNGNTAGEQNFTADNFQNLVKKVEQFIEEIGL